MIKIILVVIAVLVLIGHFVPIKTRSIQAVDPNGTYEHKYRLIKGEYEHFVTSGKNIVDKLCTGSCEGVNYKLYLW